MRGTWLVIGMGTLLAFVGACNNEHEAPNRPGVVIGSGVIATEVRAVAGFSAVSISNPGRLVIERTGAESLEVTADDNVLPLVRAEVTDGRLFLALAPDTSVAPSRRIVYRVTVAELDEVEASGAAQVELARVDARHLRVRLSGASRVTAAGECEDLDLLLSGASTADAAALPCRRVTAELSGASYGLVRASESLLVSASGASLFEYYGDPQVVSSTSGGSVVRRVGP
jgi:hypothetical protein